MSESNEVEVSDSVEAPSEEAQPIMVVPTDPPPIDLGLLTYLLKRHASETLPAGVQPTIILSNGRDYYYLSTLSTSDTHWLLSKVQRHLMEST